MRGFFSSDKTETRDSSRSYCNICGLSRRSLNAKPEPEGGFEKGVMILNNSPSDSSGRHLSQTDAKFLRTVLKKADVDMMRDCLVLSAVGCHAGDKADLSHAIHCRNRVEKAIKERKPGLIIALGLPAVQSLLQHRYKNPGKAGFGTMGRWRGWHLPDHANQAWLCPSYHPDMLQEDRTKDMMSKVIERDILFAIDMLKKPLPNFNPEKDKEHCRILHSREDIKILFDRMKKKPSLTAFDYETSGLNPYIVGHFIRSCSIYYEGISYAFLMEDCPLEALKDYLTNNAIEKIGANIKFEQKWSRAILGVDVEGFSFDTCLAAHVLDNRTGISSVKFQAAVQLGILDYASEMSEYLTTTDPKERNKVDKAPVDKLLTYNALDSYYEYHIAQMQKKEIRRAKLQNAYDLLHGGTLAFSDMEDNGFYIDEEYVKRMDRRLGRKIKDAEESLETDDLVKRWKRKYGPKFNINSGPQLADILFNDMGIEPVKFTDKGNPSTDKEALESLDLPLWPKKREMDKFSMAKNTFLNQLKEYTDKGRLHPSYNLNTARTYRSSCDSPNFQNIPIRDPEVSKLIRSAIFARPGNIVGEFDFGGIEVKVAHCYHQDPVMHKYLTDLGSDMHRDVAMDCYKLPQKEMTKEIRYCGKNKFTFPQFYGSWYANCARALWDAVKQMDLKIASGESLMEHMRRVGIGTYRKFEDHIQHVEDVFWNKRFVVYSAWKRRWWADYLKRGWFDTLTGFRCTALMGRNDAINYPVQGSAFHCLLWSLIEINKRLQERQMESCIMGQIHDSLILDIVPEEKRKVLRLCRQVMTVDLLEHWRWLIVPMEVEAELTEPGEAWYYKNKTDF